MKTFIPMCFVSMLYLTLPDFSNSQQPPYQALIFLEMPGNFVNPIHLCNGAIIYEKLILTSADCMHIKFGTDGKPNKLDASVIKVIAGSSNGKMDALQMNVSSIEIAKNFNPITLENDLALLTLSKSLPLETRSDIRWIMIDDNSHLNRSCLVNFYTRNTKDAITDYYQTEQLYMVNNEICRNSTKYPATRRRDFCSFYVLPHQFDCRKANSYLSFNNDRGTALVCQSFLVGLLSSVVTRPNPANNCTDVVLRAIYTNINPHLRWIYTVMSTMDTEYISTPYDASLNPLMANPINPPVNIPSSSNPTLVANSTTLSNSSFPHTNLTMPNHSLTNSSIVNSTLTNSTFVNSTLLSYATPHNLAINSTKLNTTSIGNHTTRPVTFHKIPSSASSVPGYGSSTDPHIKYPNPKPATPNIFTNSGVVIGISAGSLLIPLMVSVSLRLIASIYL